MGGASRPPEFAPSFHVKVMRPGASHCRAWRQEDAPVRRFNFEAEVYESLSCVPMAVRRKLDRAGVKVGLKQWQALGRGERLAICHLPAASDEEVEALHLFIREAVARGGTEPTTLSAADRAGAEPP